MNIRVLFYFAREFRLEFCFLIGNVGGVCLRLSPKFLNTNAIFCLARDISEMPRDSGDLPILAQSYRNIFWRNVFRRPWIPLRKFLKSFSISSCRITLMTYITAIFLPSRHTYCGNTQDYNQ